MSIVAFIIGMSIPTLLGWLIARLIEGNTPVLYRVERVVLGCVLGTTITMFLFFFCNAVGFLQFYAASFLLICTVACIGLGMLWMRIRLQWTTPLPSSPRSTIPLPRWIRVFLMTLALWTTMKLCIAAVLLVGSPPYFDDVYNNWNMRSKVYNYAHTLELSIETGNEAVSDAGISSYPPTVPLMKTWLTMLAGGWHEGLANAPHFIWFLCTFFLLFFFLRRHTSLTWASIGTYALASLPLYMIHGASAYADMFMALHAFCALMLLYNALTTTDAERALSFLRLSALSGALLPLTKNEGLLLHLPLFILLFVASVFWLQKREVLLQKESKAVLLQAAAMLCMFLLPWLFFKWIHGLPFGDAKPISELPLGWQPGVLTAIWTNTFMEGNWIFLIPLLLALLFTQWKTAFRTPILLFSSYFLAMYVGQMLLYCFTPLAADAIQQTGYGRGLLQLAPIMVALVVLLLRQSMLEKMKNEKCIMKNV